MIQVILHSRASPKQTPAKAVIFQLGSFSHPRNVYAANNPIDVAAMSGVINCAFASIVGPKHQHENAISPATSPTNSLAQQ